MRVATGVALIVAIAACAGAPSARAAQPTETKTVFDRVGDTSDGNGRRYPTKGSLDLVRVTILRLLNRDLVLTFETRSRVEENTIYDFAYWDAAGQHGTDIQVLIRPGHRIAGSVSIRPGVHVYPLDPGDITTRGALLTVYVSRARILYLRRFEWWAVVASIGVTPEISDRVPERGRQLLVATTVPFP